MPNRTAKDRKARRQKLNAKWAREGRTANQNKKWKAKQPQGQTMGFGRRKWQEIVIKQMVILSLLK